jgi:probable addiction module antidote protein
MRDRSNDDAMAETYREDPALAVAVLNSIFKDETSELYEVLIVLRQLAKAFGGVQSVAEIAGLNPTQIYRTLSAEGNPEFRGLMAILRALNLQLMVKHVQVAKPARAVKTVKSVKNGRSAKAKAA